MQSKKMCIGVSSKVLQKEQRAAFVIPKAYSLKIVSIVIENFILKRTQGSVSSC